MSILGKSLKLNYETVIDVYLSKNAWTTQVYTAVCVDLANCEPKSCVHEYNYVVRLPIQPVKKFTA